MGERFVLDSSTTIKASFTVDDDIFVRERGKEDRRRRLKSENQ